MGALVSLIIPVYKVEAYLERCVRSVLAQTYQNLEIILVDDGSPDRCGEICDRFAQEDPRVKVFHKANSGVSSARNYGVAHSHGAFVSFIDADDYVAPNYVEYLFDLLMKYHADIVCCCMDQTTENTSAYGINHSIPNEQLLKGKEACQALFGNLYDILVTVWGKLYKRELVQKYPFPIGRRYEDEAIVCKYYYAADRVAVGNQRLYAYYQNPDSFMHARGDSFNEDLIWALRHRAEFFREQNEPELEKAAWNMLVQHCLYESVHYHGRYDSVLKELSNVKELPPKTWLELKLYNLSPQIYKMCFEVKNKWMK